MTAEQATFPQLEAFGHANRAKAHLYAFQCALGGITGSVRGTDSPDLVKRAEQLEEFARLIAIRVESLRRHLAEGGAE